MRGGWLLLGASATFLSCSNVLGIPSDTLSFCSQPANQGHSYCEDFDVGDATKRWTFSEAKGGATLAVTSGSDRSAPNLLDLGVPAVTTAGSNAIAGYTVEFDGATFTGLHIEADVRFVTPDGGPMGQVSGGFLIVVDKSGGCVGLGLGGGGNGVPVGIGAVTFPESNGCSALTGGAASASPTGTALALAPAPNQWFHIIVEVLPDRAGLAGAGTLTFDIVGVPGSTPTVHLAAGTLVASGIPLAGFAAEVEGPSGPLEVQYDNVTIDVVSP
jgi:hypothetical protein